MLVAVALVAVACGNDDGGDAAAGRSTGQAEDGSELLGPLPAEQLELSDGTTTTLGELVGDKPLIVSFFASWCAPCRAEMPDFEAVHQDVQAEVDFLGLAMNDTREGAADVVDETGVTYPWGLDDDGTIYAAFGGFQMPTTVYISTDGEVVDQDNGAIDEGQLRDRVADLVGADGSG